MANRLGGTSTDEAGRWKYGLWVVFAGLAVILVAFGAALLAFSEAADVSTALAPVTGVVGTIVGAYFGVQAGAAGKEKAEQQRAQATELAHHALGALPEDKAEKVMQAAEGP
jgi:threonine/homoserine/homoserine lactone efflux protein